MSEITDIAGIFTSLTNLEKTRLAEDQLAQKQEELNYTRHLKQVNDKKRDDYTLTKENLHNRREENETEIARLVKEIGNWNIVAQDWSTLDDEHGKGKTKDGLEILKDMGLVYGENFKYKEQMSMDSAVQLQNTQSLIAFQDKIINDLTEKENQILRLQDDWLEVGTDANLKGLKDIEDIKSYMFENKEKFGISKDSTMENMDWVEGTNQLAKAFMKTKDTASDKYGFAMETPTDKMLKAAGLSTKEGTRGIPTSDLEKQELDLNMNANFSLFKEALAKVKTKDGNNKWAEDLGLSGFGELEGAGKLWDDERGAILLKDNMERKIIDMMKKSSDYSWVSNIMNFGKGTAQAQSGSKVREDYKLDDLDNNPALREAVVSKIFDDYAGDEMVQKYDEDGNEAGYDIRKKEKSVGGLLNKKFEDDDIFFTQRSGGDYGDAPEDEAFYYLLQTWKPLFSALGNTQ